MIRLVVKASLLIAAAWVLCAAWIEAMPMAFYNFEYPMWSYQRRVASSKLEQAPSILVLGDSRALADIIPAGLADPPGAARTLAVGGATPIEAFHMLDDYLKHNEPPKRLILSLSPYHLTRCDVFWQRTVKFKFLDLQDFLDVFASSRRLEDYPYGDFTTRPLDEKVGEESMPVEIYKDFILLYLDFPFYYQADLYGGRLFARLSGNRRVEAEMEAGFGRRMVVTKTTNDPRNHEARLETFDESPLLTSYMHRLLELCRASGIAVTYLPAPFNEKSLSALQKKWLDGFRGYLSGLRSQYPGFTFVDRIPAYPDRFFGDESHLNEDGALTYTGWIRENVLGGRNGGGA